MLRSFWFPLVAAAMLLSDTAALPPPSDHVALALANPGSNETAPNNATVPTTMSATRCDVFCSGEKYRKDLRGESCRDAVRQIPNIAQKQRFAIRGGGSYDVGLPARFMSGKFLV